MTSLAVWVGIGEMVEIVHVLSWMSSAGSSFILSVT